MVKISLFSESFTKREKEGAFCTRSKKAATNFSACVTKGRRGPRTTRAKKCPTESRRIPSSATRTRSSRRNRYVFSSYFFVVFARLTTKCILFTRSAQTKKLPLSECFFERVFRPLLVTQLFRKKKKRKNFLPFLCSSKSQDAFLYQNSSEVLTCLLYNTYSLPF